MEINTKTHCSVEETSDIRKKAEKSLRTPDLEQKDSQHFDKLTSMMEYRLEDKAFKALPVLLKRDYEIDVKERLVRKFVTDNKGKSIEVNIIGKATRGGKELTIQ